MDQTPSLRAQEAGGEDRIKQIPSPSIPELSSPLEKTKAKPVFPTKMTVCALAGVAHTRLNTSLQNAPSGSPKEPPKKPPKEQSAQHSGLSIRELSLSSALQCVPSHNTDSALDVYTSDESGVALISPSVATSDALGILAMRGSKSAAAKASIRKSSPGERLQRSRERNRMHARKTRQRKKEHMQNLQNRADELKREQLSLRQGINEKNTASILVGLFSVGQKSLNGTENPEVERLLQRPVEEIPDASKISELPALILPGQHNSAKKAKPSSSTSREMDMNQPQHDFPDDGIDYQLLGKDRASCTPAELDQIRRERNRMHAKRTRDRKRIFMEEMEEIIKKMEEENVLLQEHLDSLGGAPPSSLSNRPPQLVSPMINPADASKQDCSADSNLLAVRQESKATVVRESPEQRRQLVSQLKSLLVAAGAFEQPNNPNLVVSSSATAVSATDDSSCDHEALSFTARKRRRLEVPQSITTTASVIGA